MRPQLVRERILAADNRWVGVMRKVLAVLAMFSLPAVSSAAFVNNYSEWGRLSPDQRLGFVQGWVDVTVTMRAADRVDQARSQAIFACLQRTRVTDATLAQSVTDLYRSNPALWRLAASVLLYATFVGVCQEELSEVASRFGYRFVPFAEFISNLTRPAAR